MRSSTKYKNSHAIVRSCQRVIVIRWSKGQRTRSEGGEGCTLQLIQLKRRQCAVASLTLPKRLTLFAFKYATDAPLRIGRPQISTFDCSTHPIGMTPEVNMSGR